MGGKGAGLPDFCHMRLTSLSGISKFSNTAFQELCGTIFLVRTLMSWGRALMSALCLVSFGGNQIYLGSIYHAMELYLFIVIFRPYEKGFSCLAALVTVRADDEAGMRRVASEHRCPFLMPLSERQGLSLFR